MSQHISADHLHKMRVVVMGPGGVGKSATTLQFVRNTFLEEYDPTIEDSYSKTLNIEPGVVELDIIDTAGQEEFRKMWGDKHISNGDGFLLVFSLVDENSIRDLEEIRQQIEHVKDRCNVPMIICGNKCDFPEEEWELSKKDGEEFAVRSNSVYIQTSAKDKINIDEAFSVLVKRIQEDRRIQAARKAEYAQNAQANKKSKGGKDKGKGGDGEGSGSKSNGKKGCTIL